MLEGLTLFFSIFQLAPGHGNANQGGHMGCAQGYGQPQYTGAVGVQQGGATGYGGTNSRGTH